MAGIYRDRQMLRRWSGLAPILPPQRSSGAVPRAIPPHPPLQSGGWYRSLVRWEVLGPGRYPIDFAGRKSVGTALVLAALFGPVGLCYLSIVTGMVATALAVAVVRISGAGLVPLLVMWPLAMVWVAGWWAWRNRQPDREY